MRKIIFTIAVLYFTCSGFVNAELNFENNYTVIDCIDGNDNSGEAFQKDVPYQTLKTGIEKTIEYINLNINKTGNEETASGQIFNIKVNCIAKDMFVDTININFDGIKYNNKLVIEGVGNNGLVFDNIKIKHYHATGNYEIKNAVFKNYDTPIFIYNIARRVKPYSKGIVINDSIFYLKDNFKIGVYSIYDIYSTNTRGHGFRSKGSSFFNEQIIKNSVINIEIDNNSTISMPAIIKNSKINFTNLSNKNNNINFSLVGSSIIGYSFIKSNELNFGGNNISFSDNSNIGFINNKFTNFNNITIPNKPVFLNNTFKNTENMDISTTGNFYNNTFSSGFVDTNDTFNKKKNFLESESGAKGIGWIYKRKSSIDYFNIDIRSYSFFEELTGIKIPNLKDSVYVIFNK